MTLVFDSKICKDKPTFQLLLFCGSYDTAKANSTGYVREQLWSKIQNIITPIHTKIIPIITHDSIVYPQFFLQKTKPHLSQCNGFYFFYSVDKFYICKKANIQLKTSPCHPRSLTIWVYGRNLSYHVMWMKTATLLFLLLTQRISTEMKIGNLHFNVLGKLKLIDKKELSEHKM